MLIKLFLAFTIVPFVELYLLIKAGGYLGALNTIIIVILTGFLGALLAKFQGMHTMQRVKESLDKGELPAEDMMDAVLIFLAGMVLLTPGFITDIAGLLILIPVTRMFFKRWLRKRFDSWVSSRRLNITFRE